MARILIADDDPRVREVIARICQFKGHEIAEAPDTAQALGMLASFKPDLVVTDLAMPLGGGQQLIREIRANPETARCPVIVVTGYAGLLSSAERDALAPCTVLAKPLDLEPMLAAVETALQSDASAES